ncbi:cytosolic factor, phosphatidylinositol/phosphatidylcholine transfer protein [Friedmanniomyces endolithicus]|uniref:Cytosolic factor, phosphatidylinositol/phosphatidylcholine transfer protein n=1 Tax=Rachicladosporium monterosium TaxID=1507873 RepID=A0ABR0L9M3_9PEZI|nr:cytosolic factor, phosphatidylinositol/phosphatidylcholine transfer protein [Friedmanniomyces endolithicus]KAK5145548.1 cytosolic factor, phosphatidylinositol/phosphatidylcholine transfer protein [Rachicladosporium monterosium]
MASNPHMELDQKYDHYDFPTTAPETKPGHPGHTTKEQDAAVHQIRMLLEKEGYTKNLDTLTLLRFLRARKFDVQLSKKMFEDCEKWRAEFGGGVDNLVRTFNYKEKPQIMAYYPQYYHKTDREGRPVYIESMGKIDLHAMRKITTDERMLQNLVVEYEKLADPRLPACSRKSGQLLETCCTIMDMKGSASGISQNYYPERLGKLYIINAPWGFSSVFSVVKRFLDPVTVAKIHVLGSSYQKELFGQVPKENLPKQVGGTCACPGGCELSDEGPWRELQWSKPAAWESNDLPAMESHTGQGMPAGAHSGAYPPQEVFGGQTAHMR